MGGFGFPMFGGGFGNWGLGGGNRAADTTGTSSTKKSADDKDYAKLNDLHAEANKLVKDIQDGKITNPAKAIDDLNKKLDDYKKLDKKQTAENDEQIENIKKQLADAKAGLDVKPTGSPVAIQNQGVVTSTSGETPDKFGFTPSQDAALRETGSCNLDLIKQIANDWGISPTDLITLRKLGCGFLNIGKYNNAGKNLWALTLPSINQLTAENLGIIKTITDKADVIVAVGENKDSVDKFVAGKLDDISDTGGHLTYTIDAKRANDQGVAKLGKKYQVTHKEGNTYNIKNLENADDNQDYTIHAFVKGQGALLTRSGKPPLVKFE